MTYANNSNERDAHYSMQTYDSVVRIPASIYADECSHAIPYNTYVPQTWWLRRPAVQYMCTAEITAWERSYTVLNVSLRQ